MATKPTIFGRSYYMWRTVNFSICGKHWSCLWKGGGGKTERMALFRDCYSKSQNWSAYKLILMASPEDGWILHTRASQEPVHRDRAGMFGGAFLGIQLVLNARNATELHHRHHTAVHSLLLSPAFSAPHPVQGLHGKLKLFWELAFTKMIDSGTLKFPSVNSAKWKSSC